MLDEDEKIRFGVWGDMWSYACWGAVIFRKRAFVSAGDENRGEGPRGCCNGCGVVGASWTLDLRGGGGTGCEGDDMAKLCGGGSGWILEWRWNVFGRGFAMGCEAGWPASGERVLGGRAGTGGGGDPM